MQKYIHEYELNNLVEKAVNSLKESTIFSHYHIPPIISYEVTEEYSQVIIELPYNNVSDAINNHHICDMTQCYIQGYMDSFL